MQIQIRHLITTFITLFQPQVVILRYCAEFFLWLQFFFIRASNSNCHAGIKGFVWENKWTPCIGLGTQYSSLRREVRLYKLKTPSAVWKRHSTTPPPPPPPQSNKYIQYSQCWGRKMRWTLSKRYSSKTTTPFFFFLATVSPVINVWV